MDGVYTFNLDDSYQVLQQESDQEESESITAHVDIHEEDIASDLDSLPVEIIGNILSFCQMEDHFRFVSTCKKWLNIFNGTLYTRKIRYRPSLFNDPERAFVVNLMRKCVKHLDASQVRLSDEDADIITSMLKIKRLDLQGTKPRKVLEKIGNLKSIKYLDISSCNIRSSHIVLLETLAETLVSLDLSENDLTSEDVELISKLTNLEHLSLSHCGDIGYKAIKSIHKLPSLQSLYIANCFSLCNKALKYIGKMAELVKLNARGCPFDESGLRYIRSLSKLEALNICGTNLSWIPSTLALMKHFPNMKKLHSNGRFSDDMVKNLTHMSGLSNIKLEGFLSPESLSTIASFKYMTDIEIHDCLSLTKDGLDSFSNFYDIRSLILEGCSLLEEGSLSFLKQFSKLKKISINGSPFLGDKDAYYISHMVSLEFISFRDTGITDAGVSSWGNLVHVKTLLLGNQPINFGPKSLVTSNALQDLINLKNLKKLRLCNFERQKSHSWKYISNFTNLTALELICCGIGDDDIQFFDTLIHLEKLDLSLNNSINPSAFHNLVDIPKLNYIYVENKELWTKGELRTLLSWQNDGVLGEGGEVPEEEDEENGGGEQGEDDDDEDEED